MACIPITPALWRLRQEDGEFKANLGYIARPFVKKPRAGWQSACLA
jgi:hypothetical protein